MSACLLHDSIVLLRTPITSKKITCNSLISSGMLPSGVKVFSSTRDNTNGQMNAAGSDRRCKRDGEKRAQYAATGGKVVFDA